MLVQSKNLQNVAVVGLHTGQPLASLAKAIIDPHKLTVAAYFLNSPESGRREPLVLLTSDIRDASPKRVLINSSDEFSPLKDLIRLKEVVEINFNLIQKPVRTESKKRLGKVDDYVVDTLNFEIQKLYVRQPIFKSMSLHSLVVDRSQIIEVSDRFVTVADAVTAEPAVAPTSAETA